MSTIREVGKCPAHLENSGQTKLARREIYLLRWDMATYISKLVCKYCDFEKQRIILQPCKTSPKMGHPELLWWHQSHQRFSFTLLSMRPTSWGLPCGPKQLLKLESSHLPSRPKKKKRKEWRANGCSPSWISSPFTNSPEKPVQHCLLISHRPP